MMIIALYLRKGIFYDNHTEEQILLSLQPSLHAL